LYQAVSYDDGRSWTGLHETPMWGHPAHVLALADGRLVCTYGYRRPPFGVRACVSYDGGCSWAIEREFVLRDDGGSRDLGYPSTAELPDGRLLTVYYFHGQDDVRHIAATRWHPD
jgi:sialidase-1